MNKKNQYKGNKGLEYYKAYPRDFFDGSVGLDGPVRGFYRMVIDLIYMHDGFLLDDWGHISGNTGFSQIKCKRMMAVLIEKGKIHVLQEKEKFFTQKRTEIELKHSRKFQEKQTKNILSRWENNGLADDMVIPPQDHKTTRPKLSPSALVENEDSDISPLFGNEQKKEPDPPKISKAEIDKHFADFWDAFPHRNGKKTKRSVCEKKFHDAIRSGTSVQDIAQGVSAMHRDPEVHRGYGRMAETWLHQKGWQDEIPTNGETQNGIGNTNRTGRDQNKRRGSHDSLMAAFAETASEDPDRKG